MTHRSGLIGVAPVPLDLELVKAAERASLQGWPPTVVHELAGGWILRATPGLDRGRSNNALTPLTRSLDAGELPLALERVRAWSALHGVRGGLQVSPLELHGAIIPALLAAGWQPSWKVWVMVADRTEALDRRAVAAAPDALSWIPSRSPEPAWRDAWAACRGSREGIDSHVATVFRNLDGRGVFGRLGDVATGLAAEDAAGEWAGLFALVVRDDQRGRGLGRRLVRSLIESVAAPRIYLQVEMSNAAAIGLYTSLGFTISHSYQHLQAPESWSAS